MNPVVSSYAFGLFFGSLLPVRVSSILLEMSPGCSPEYCNQAAFSPGLDRYGRRMVVRRMGNRTLVGFSYKG